MVKNIRNLIIICVFCVLICSGCTKEGYLPPKTFVGGVDIGGMSREEAIDALSSLNLDKDKKAVVSVDEIQFTVSASEIEAAYNAEGSVDNAMKEKSGFFAGFVKKEFPMSVWVNTELLEQKIRTIESDVVQTAAQITGEGIQVVNGTSGKSVDREKMLLAITRQLGGNESEEEVLSYTVVKPDEINNKDDFLNPFLGAYKDAAYVKGADGTVSVTEEANGVEFDVEAAKVIMSEHTKEGEVYVIPCNIVFAQKTKADLEEKLFRDTLGKFSSSFATSSANRGHNIALAASSINNTIIMPGEAFSFNNSLGERTAERGYKTAGAYVGGKTVDQVGGGICQVSSTLYNAVLRANLEIVERRNHQMTVAYVPIGLDATVNWGTTDFRFKNNTEYPVKVVGVINGKNVEVSIVGTATIPGMKVEIVTNTTSVLSPEEEVVKDDTKPVSYSSVTKGKNGYVVEAVRIVYSNGAEVSRGTLPKSRYNPTKTVKVVGTLPEVPAMAQTTPEAETPGQQATAVDPYQVPPGV